jgi:hypothetical protein
MGYKKGSSKGSKGKGNKICKTDERGGRPMTPVEIAAYGV